MAFGGYGKRKRRASKQSIVGSRFVIGCSNRGESEDNMLALCGWGECLQQFRNVEVLRRVGGQWQTAALSVATCCDCRVRAGTEVHALVVGDRK
ncbi:unnamed protein product [Heligmosomoides polygyrus]|uniref:Uncharacterized protein n=1 Tax=Heligmosomoides polygyrus TaxID=6339 RepID=A0A183G9S2_HELPZ|nr:unnamed protein product [Heligmosomoides polygyrus]